MKRVTIFSLETVVRFNRSDLRQLLFALAEELHSIKLKEDPAPEVRNFDQLLQIIFKEAGKSAIAGEELEDFRKAFKKGIKKLYLKDEEAFEVRPGIQVLFGQLEKEKRWKYAILSDFWEESTRFILQSCGVFSKDKLTIHAEDGAHLEAQTKVLIDRLKDDETELQFMCLEEAPDFLKGDFKILRPKKSKKETNYYVYPKFNELFGIKRKKKSKGK